LPSAHLIERYLRNSSFIEVENGYARFLGENAEFNDIEKDVIEYFSENSSSSYPELFNYLTERNYGKPHADKSIFHSPIVYIDKSEGRSNYRYYLISRFSSSSASENNKDIDEKYLRYKERLKKIFFVGTDKDVGTKRRREQNILQDWLFEENSAHNCAICGKEYDDSALVAAHKKKRSECTENERLDPYIVMPLCLFGCDYLYENGYIFVFDRKIKLDASKTLDGFAKEYADSLSGRELPEDWLKGESGYFAKPEG
jgi:hypothetical protein